MKAKIYVTLLMMAMYPSGHCLAAEPWWVVGSFKNIAGATTLQARLESQLAESVWIVPHPDRPLHRVVIRVADVSEARLDAAGITAWKTDLDFAPAPRAVKVQPAPGSDRHLPEVSQEPALPDAEPLLPGETMLAFCMRVPSDPFCQTAEFRVVQQEVQSVEALRQRLLTRCAGEAEPAMRRVCDQYAADLSTRGGSGGKP